MSGKFWLLLSAYFLSSAGDWVSRLAVPIVLFHITGSAFCLSLAYAMTFLPFLVVTPIGGVLADCIDRRSMLVLGDAAAASLVGFMVVTASAAPAAAWPFYPILFVLFSVVAVYHPTFQSYLPSLLAETDLAKGNSYISAADNLTDILGPAMGGMLIAAVGAVNALYVDAVSFVFSALCIYCIDAKPLALGLRRVTSTMWWDDLRDGAAYVFRQPVLRFACLLFASTNLGITLFTSNFMFFLLAHLKLNSVGVGMVLGVAGCGAILGSLAAPHITRSANEGFLMLISNVVGGLGLLALAWLRNPLAVAAVWSFVLAANSVVVVTFFTLRQRIVPIQLLGRAVAMTRFVSFLTVPLSAALAGWLVEQSNSVETVTLISGAIVMAAGFVGMLTPLNAPAALAQVPDYARPRKS